jgi:hypothetical protein
VLLAQIDKCERVPAPRPHLQTERPCLVRQVAEDGMVADAAEPVSGVFGVNKQDKQNMLRRR